MGTKERECGRKRQFPTRREAEAAAWHRRRKYAAMPRDTNVYRCSFCGSWHLGHRPRRRR